jgi:cytochrome c551/c552
MRVPVGVKVSVFSLLVMGSYSYYANSIPQIESKPPQELSLEGGNVTTAQLVKAGEEIYKAKPGQSAKQYLVESLLQPTAIIVEGYPPIMPAVDKPPIALNRSEVWALTAFLESLGGTVEVKLDDIPKSVGSAAAGSGAPAEVKLPGDPKAGKAVFMGKGGCLACHKASDIPGTPVGPDLSQIAKIQTPDYIMRKILDPAGMGTVAGFPKGVMPPTLGQTLNAREYTDLVAFLLTLK